MEVLNETTVALIFSRLNTLFSFLPANASVNERRQKQISSLCDRLNDLHRIPDGYCPFYFDKISCWNATPPQTTAKMRCVSWQFDRPNPDGEVELRCDEGTWRNRTLLELISAYMNCKLPAVDSTLEYGFVVAQFGYFASTISLLIACAIFIYLRKLYCGRNIVHFNLFVALILRSVFSIVQFAYSTFFRHNYEMQMSSTTCRSITTIWKYFFLSSYFWIFVEGFYLHNIIYISVFKETSIWPYALLAWGGPLIITACWLIIKALFDPSRCWLSLAYMQVVKIPLGIISFLEAVIAISIARLLYYKLKAANSLADDKEKYRKLAKSTLYLICGTGANFFIFDVFLVTFDLLSSHANIAHLVQMIINSFWGVFVSLLYCFLNEEIRSEFRMKIGSRKISLPRRRDQRQCGESCSHQKDIGAHANCTSGANECSECKIRKSLMECKVLVSRSSGGNGTQCSTVANSTQSTLNGHKQSYPPRVSHLSYCREECEDL